jgi:hypothetical protein
MGIFTFYVVLPIFLGGMLIKYLKKHAPAEVARDVKELYAKSPVEKKWYRAARRDHKGLKALGDFETRGEAVESAYQGRKDAAAAGEKAAFVVLDDKGFALEQVDS